MTTDLGKAIRTLGNFTGPNLTGTLSKIEGDIRGLDHPQCVQLLDNLGAQQSVLQAAQSVKAIVGQINVVIHALGILRCLPHILEKGERVEYASLGAGNTGRSFDLETNFRIAEFKFINWRGGSEAVRQDSLFKDLFVLANATTPKRKFLYLLGTEQALKFLNGKRKLDSVLKRHASIHDQLKSKFPSQLIYVKDYFALVQGDVSLVDVSPWLVELNVEA